MICDELKGNGAPKDVSEGMFEYLPNSSRTMINRWFKRAYENIEGGHEAAFDGFIHCWMAFNAWGSCVTKTETDAHMVYALISHDRFNNLWDGLIQDTASPFYTAATEFRKLWPIFKSIDTVGYVQGLPSRTDRSQIISHYLPRIGEYQPKCYERHHEHGYPLDWPHTLKTIYRVRCNLFHGWKDFETEMDQRIVKLSFQVLGRFLKATNIFQ